MYSVNDWIDGDTLGLRIRLKECGIAELSTAKGKQALDIVKDIEYVEIIPSDIDKYGRTIATVKSGSQNICDIIKQQCPDCVNYNN
jgi:endonuclease YncB( thermonuclease family)